MTLQQRIDVLVKLGNYMQNNGQEWKSAKEQANRANPWFVPEFIEMSSGNICTAFLQKDKLSDWVKNYGVLDEVEKPVTVGLVMAGNIPMVGFHDMLCVFASGHKQLIKLSSKDNILIKHLVSIMQQGHPALQEYISLAENLKGCGAYIATGSNNSSR